MIQILLLLLVNNIFIMLLFIATFLLIYKMTNQNIKTPIEVIKEEKKRKNNKEELERQKQIMEQNLENIENYDGTPTGQKDIK